MVDKNKLKMCNSNNCMICDIDIECYNYEKFICDQNYLGSYYLNGNYMTYSKSHIEKDIFEIIKEIESSL